MFSILGILNLPKTDVRTDRQIVLTFLTLEYMADIRWLCDMCAF